MAKLIIKKLNSSRTHAITKYADDLHAQVDELYEALMDSEMEDVIKIQKEINALIRAFKVEPNN